VVSGWGTAMGLFSNLTRRTVRRSLVGTDIASAAHKVDPYPFYAHLRAEDPVHRGIAGGLPAWIVSRYDDVVMVLKDDRFAKDQQNALTPEQAGKQPWVPAMFRPLTRNMLDLDPPDHTRLRALVQRAFTPRLVEQMRPRIQGLADRLLDGLRCQQHFDLIRDFALPIPTTVIAEMLGVPFSAIAAGLSRFRRVEWNNFKALSYCMIKNTKDNCMHEIIANRDVRPRMRYLIMKDDTQDWIKAAQSRLQKTVDELCELLPSSGLKIAFGFANREQEEFAATMSECFGTTEALLSSQDKYFEVYLNQSGDPDYPDDCTFATKFSTWPSIQCDEYPALPLGNARRMYNVLKCCDDAVNFVIVPNSELADSVLVVGLRARVPLESLTARVLGDTLFRLTISTDRIWESLRGMADYDNWLVDGGQ
jgi:hypothetical protein